jgi:hypothetical protein
MSHALLLAALLAGSAPAKATIPADSLPLIGWVRDAETDLPVVSARVWIGDSMRALLLMGARTDSTGRFKILRVPEGRHVMNVWHPDYRSGVVDVEVSEEAARESLLLILRAKPDSLKPARRPPVEWGSIAGTVVDARTGLALSGVSVGVPRLYTRSISDEGGRFHIARLRTGTFSLVASRDGYKTVSKEIELAGGADLGSLTMKMTPEDPPEPPILLKVPTDGGEVVQLMIRTPSDHPAMGADVRLAGFEAIGVTDSTGALRFRIPIGHYSMTIQYPGLPAVGLPLDVGKGLTGVHGIQLQSHGCALVGDYLYCGGRISLVICRNTKVTYR